MDCVLLSTMSFAAKRPHESRNNVGGDSKRTKLPPASEPAPEGLQALTEAEEDEAAVMQRIAARAEMRAAARAATAAAAATEPSKSSMPISSTGATALSLPKLGVAQQRPVSTSAVVGNGAASGAPAAPVFLSKAQRKAQREAAALERLASRRGVRALLMIHI